MRRDEEGAGHRHLRVQSLVLEELRALLRDDVSDPDVGDVHVVAVALSVDYRHARVHFVLSGTSGVEPRPTLRALERATPFLRARLAERHIGIELSDAAVEYLVKVGYDPTFGARPLKRAIQKEVETPLARRLVAGEVRDGQNVRVNLGPDHELTFEVESAARAEAS